MCVFQNKVYRAASNIAMTGGEDRTAPRALAEATMIGCATTPKVTKYVPTMSCHRHGQL